MVVSRRAVGSASAAAGWQSVQRRRSRPQQSAPAAPSNGRRWTLMTIFRSDLSLKQPYIVLRWMIEASASQKEASVGGGLHIKSKSLALWRRLIHLFSITDSMLCQMAVISAIVMANPIANQQAETTPRPLLITASPHNRPDENGC